MLRPAEPSGPAASMTTRELAGKVVLLTGATDGIGEAAAARFAAMDATLAIVGRDGGKAARTVQRLRAMTGNGSVSCLIGDLSKASGVQAVARAFRSEHGRLDVLANNAGAMFSQRTLTEDGLEMTFALNHMAYFGLTMQLLDLLVATPGARVVNTASGSHRSGRLDPRHIAKRRGRARYQAYCGSKLANVVFTKALARRLAPSGATANCFHPGFVRSGFGRDAGGLLASLMRSRLAARVARTPEQGADTLVWLAASPAASAFNGEYFFDRTVSPVARSAQDEGLAAGLWALSGHLLGLTGPQHFPCSSAGAF